MFLCFFFFFSSRRRHTRYWRDWSSDVCSSDLKGVNASNTSFIGEHTYYTRGGQRIHFAWITNSGSLSSVTSIISHELVESATDPEGSAWLGVAGTCNQGGWCEIADVCSSVSQLDGVTVQSYWSNQDGACSVPAWPNRTYPRVG